MATGYATYFELVDEGQYHVTVRGIDLATYQGDGAFSGKEVAEKINTAADERLVCDLFYIAIGHESRIVFHYKVHAAIKAFVANMVKTGKTSDKLPDELYEASKYTGTVRQIMSANKELIVRNYKQTVTVQTVKNDLKQRGLSTEHKSLLCVLLCDHLWTTTKVGLTGFQVHKLNACRKLFKWSEVEQVLKKAPNVPAYLIPYYKKWWAEWYNEPK